MGDSRGGFAALRSGHQAKTKGLSKSGRETVDRDLKGRGSDGPCIASKPLLPTETPICTLCPCLYRLFGGIRFLCGLSRSRCQRHSLHAQPTNPTTTDAAAFPILPENRTRSRGTKRLPLRRLSLMLWRRIAWFGRVERKDHGADPSWLGLPSDQRMLRLGWAETKILFCVLLAKLLSPAQQGVVPAPIPISLVDWLIGTRCARSLVSEHLSLFYSFSLGVV